MRREETGNTKTRLEGPLGLLEWVILSEGAHIYSISPGESRFV
jgi:hypothetical protein